MIIILFLVIILIFFVTCNDNLVIPDCILTLYTELVIVLAKLKNIFFDNFDYRKVWKTVALMVCFNSFNFIQQISTIFKVTMFSLTWLQKISVLLFISFLLMLIGFLKKFWRFIKRNLLFYFCKNGVLRNFAKLTGKHLCQSLAFNKAAGWGLKLY